jgi:alkylhydroperoxidase family enzyme
VARVEIPEGDGDELLRLYSLSPTMGAAAGDFSASVYNDTKLPTRLREVARMVIADVNRCPVCLDTRTVSDPLGLTEDEYVALASGSVPDTLSDREAAAAEFARTFSTDHLSMDDDFWDRARARLSDPELFELGICCAAWLGLGRVTQAFGAGVSCRIEY